MNIHGFGQIWNGQQWNPIKANLDVEHGPVMQQFSHMIDNYDQWVEEEHPSVSEEVQLEMDQMIDMLTKMNPDIDISPDGLAIRGGVATWSEAAGHGLRIAGYSITAILMVAIPVLIVWYCCGKDAVMPCVIGCVTGLFRCLRATLWMLFRILGAVFRQCRCFTSTDTPQRHPRALGMAGKTDAAPAELEFVELHPRRSQDGDLIDQ